MNDGTTPQPTMDPYLESFQSWDNVAQLYQEKFMDLEVYNDTYDAFCRLIPQSHPRILEIGCGPGNISRYLLSQRPDLELQAIDVAPTMIQLARANNPGAHFTVMDCREISTLPGKYDGIISGFCLPYLSRPDALKLIKDCWSLLTPGGVLYLSMMEGDYGKSGLETGSTGKDRMFVYYYDSEDLQQWLKRAGFEMLELFRKPGMKTSGTGADQSILIAARKP